MKEGIGFAVVSLINWQSLPPPIKPSNEVGKTATPNENAPAKLETLFSKLDLPL